MCFANSKHRSNLCDEKIGLDLRWRKSVLSYPTFAEIDTLLEQAKTKLKVDTMMDETEDIANNGAISVVLVFIIKGFSVFHLSDPSHISNHPNYRREELDGASTSTSSAG